MNIFAITWCILAFVVLPVAAIVHERRVRDEEPEGIPEEGWTYRPLYVVLQSSRSHNEVPDVESADDVDTKLCA